MLMPTGMRRERVGIRFCVIAFMVIALTTMLAAESFAKDIIVNVKVKENGMVKTMKIRFDKDMNFKEAKVEGRNVDIIEGGKFPITLPGCNKVISEIRPGSIIVFEGSTCIPIPDGRGGIRWLAYPPGTQCP